MRIRKKGDLLIAFARPGLKNLNSETANLAQTHLKLIRAHGTLLLYGQKPRTCVYIVEMDISRGYPLPKLAPII